MNIQLLNDEKLGAVVGGDEVLAFNEHIYVATPSPFGIEPLPEGYKGVVGNAHIIVARPVGDGGTEDPL